MSDNSKNLLQTYCQKRKLDLPVYTSEFNNSTRQWTSSVSFTDEHQVHHVTGQPQTRRTDADISAAQEAYQTIAPAALQLSDNIVADKYHMLDLVLPVDGDTKPVYVLVDYENINKLNYLHNKFVNEKGYPLYVLKFVGYCNHKAETDEPTHVVQCNGRDAVDHFISMYLGMLIQKLCKPVTLTLQDITHIRIIVLTKDIFGSHYTKFVDSLSGIIVYHCASENSCMQLLKEFGYIDTLRRISYLDHS